MTISRGLFVSVAVCALLCGCDHFKKEPTLSEKDQSMMHMAENFKASGHLKEAATLYTELVASSTGPVDAHLELASIYRKIGQLPDALIVLQKARTLQPKNVKVLNAMGNALLADKKPAEAIATFDEAIAADPKNPAAYNGKGIALDNLERHKQAQESYRKSLALNPPNAADVTSNLAMSMILSSQFSSAIKLLEPQVKAPGASKTMRQNLALAYGLNGNKEKALALNLEDLPPEQAKENMRFYEHYKKQLKQKKVASEKLSPSLSSEVNAPKVTTVAAQAAPVYIEEAEEESPPIKESEVKQSTKPAAKASAKPAAKTATQKAKKPVTKTAAKPSKKTTKLAAKPAPKPQPKAQIKTAKAKTIYSPKLKKVVTVNYAPAPSSYAPSAQAPSRSNELNTTRPPVNTGYPSGR